MSNHAAWNFWDIEDPFIIEAGDTVRTHREWENTTSEPLAYPREMCTFLKYGGTAAAR